MKKLIYVPIVLLVLLALLSGVSKILLVPQEVEFFSGFGLSNIALIIFGIVQLIGAVLLALPTTRFAGALVIAVTFLISSIALLQAGNAPMAIVTLVCVAVLAFIAFRYRPK